MSPVKEPLPPKVVALYEAVNDFLIEGVDLSTLTVSDITKKAGIGKGTAYEYFDSKEDIIVNALLYESTILIDDYNRTVTAADTFEKKIRVTLQWIADHYIGKQAFGQFIKIVLSSQNYALKFRECFFGKRCQYLDELQIIENIVAAGKSEHFFRDTATDYELEASIASQLGMFLVFLKEQHRYPNISYDEAAEVAWENIKRLVGK